MRGEESQVNGIYQVFTRPQKKTSINQGNTFTDISNKQNTK